MIKYKGILFDFDGVLARTMDDHFRAWNHALGLYGASIAPQDFFQLEGMPVLGMSRRICRMAGLDISIALHLLDSKDAYYLMHKDFALYPKVEEIVSEFYEKGIPMGIVSGGRQERIKASLPAEFLNKFRFLISGEDTPRGKPFPDPYLEGAKRLGILPQECIVVENAPLGIKSAKAAGCYCIAIASTIDREKLQEADEVVGVFVDLQGSLSLQRPCV